VRRSRGGWFEDLNNFIAMYKFFVDDSGSKEYKNPYDKELSDSLYPWSANTKSWLDDNFFVLC
jgi:hypothetical protein